MISPIDTAMACREALSAMRPTGEPCPGISASEWPVLCDRAFDLLEQHGERAVELGWTVEDLFGVHPKLGIRRVDHADALVVGAGRPIGYFDADRMQRGHLNYYRTKPGRRVGIPIWCFKE